MRELVVGTFVTLDGVMQAPGAPDEDRSGGFPHGGWQVPLFTDEVGVEVTRWIEGTGALLLGRATYDVFAAHWPRVGDDDPIAAHLNRVPKYVASRTLTDPAWAGTTVVRDVASEVAALRAGDGGEIQVAGSAGLVQTLLREDLVDEIRLLVFPVVLGVGKRLFGDGTVPRTMALAEARVLAGGVVLQRYRRGGPLVTGSFALDAP